MKNLFFMSRRSRELRKLARENQGKALSILDDEVFKAMLTENNEDSREALRSLISAVTHREVSALQVINNELLPDYKGAKKPRVDVLVSFNDGETANLEMQTEKSDDDIRKRAEYYKSKLVAGQLARGKPYSSLKRVYQVFFLNCVLFPNSGKLPRRYFYQEEAEHDRLSEVSEIIFYELPKLKQKFMDFQSGKLKIESLTDDEKWCIYIRYRHEEHAKELIKRLCQKEAGLMYAEKAVSKVSRSYKRFAKQFLKMKAEMENEAYRNMLEKDAREAGYADGKIEGYVFGHTKGHETGLEAGREEGLEKGREEGLEKGREEGLEKGREEIARKLKARGRPLEEIVEDTGLPLEVIENL